MDFQEIYEKKSKFATRKVGDELILVPIKTNVADMSDIFTLNEVGSFIWDSIDGVKSFDNLVSDMVLEFEIDEVTARNDLNEFIERLKTLIENI